MKEAPNYRDELEQILKHFDGSHVITWKEELAKALSNL